ncbi:MAG: ABC transporter ATP-binding protein [Thermomicrobiales bacterium]
MTRIELIDVVKRYGGVNACDGVDLLIDEGEFITLLGPSGCGKSTTLNLIAGLDEVTSGLILMNDRRVNDFSPYERDVAMVFQQYALYPHMTVAENIGFTLRLRKRPKTEIRERVTRVAELLELTPLLERLPRELSGGQQQRVAIGRAVIREPGVFLFDEPFSNLDAALRVRMRSEVRQLHDRLGVTSVFVTHDQEEAMSISDRIAVMRAGKVEQFGTPEEVYAAPATKYVAQFVGSPRMDIFAGDVKAIADDVVLAAGGLEIPLPRWIADLTPDAGIEMGIRPEHVELVDEGLPAIVRLVQPIGPETHVTIGWDGIEHTLTARLPGIARYQHGDSVQVSLRKEAMVFFDPRTGKRITPPRT